MRSAAGREGGGTEVELLLRGGKGSRFWRQAAARRLLRGSRSVAGRIAGAAGAAAGPHRLPSALTAFFVAAAAAGSP